MGESSTSSSTKSKFQTFNRFNAIILCTCACTLLQHKIFLLCIHFKRLLQLGTIIWLPSVFILDILVFAIIYAFLTAPYRWHLRTNAAAFMSKTFATLFAVFVIVVTCTSMVLLIETGTLPKVFHWYRPWIEMEVSIRSGMVFHKVPLYSSNSVIFNHPHHATDPRSPIIPPHSILAINSQTRLLQRIHPLIQLQNFTNQPLLWSIRNLSFKIRIAMVESLEIHRVVRNLPPPHNTPPSNASMESTLTKPNRRSSMDPLPSSPPHPQSNQHTPSNLEPKLHQLRRRTTLRPHSRPLKTSTRIPKTSNP